MTADSLQSCMQDEYLKGVGPWGFILDLPRPLWTVLGRDQPPRALMDFGLRDYVVNAAEGCGCLLVRTKQRVKYLGNRGESSRCTTCMRQGNRNCQELEMLERVRCLVKERPEHILLCCQVPLPGRFRCDVVLVPRAAREMHHLLVVELDGINHEHKPMHDAEPCDGFNATVDSDAAKQEAVRNEGMRFVRVSWSSMQNSNQWRARISSELDNIMQQIMILPM